MSAQPDPDRPGQPVAVLASAPSSSSSEAPEHTYRKIARLLKVFRDLINHLLDDSVPYQQIIAKLEQMTAPALPYPISEMNLSRWKDSGYRWHVTGRDCLATVRANRERASDLVTSDDAATLPEATLQIIASQYYQLLGDFSPESLKQKLAEDPVQYTRFLNVFARLSREILHLKKYRQAAAKAAALELKKLDPNREFTEREDQILTERMDNFFKKPRRKKPQTNEPPAATAKPPISTFSDNQGARTTE